MKLLYTLLLAATLSAQTTQLGLESSTQVMIAHSNRLPPMTYSVFRELGCSVTWARVNTASGVFNSTNLDACATTAIGTGATTLVFQLTQTPPWISSNPTDTGCNASPQFNGSCDPPSDINSDGTGTDATFKAYCTWLFGHVTTKF